MPPRSTRSNRVLPDNFALIANLAEAEVIDVVPAVVPANHIPIMAAPAEVWTENPLFGDYNPGNATRQKIFKEKSKGLLSAERLEMNKANATKIHQFISGLATHLGKCVTHVPVEYAAGTATDHVNLIEQ